MLSVIKETLESYKNLKLELDMLSAIEHKTDDIYLQIKSIQEQRKTVLDIINMLPDPVLKAYLIARYINGLRHWEIAEAFDVDERTCYRNIKAGIEQLQIITKDRSSDKLRGSG